MSTHRPSSRLLPAALLALLLAAVGAVFLRSHAAAAPLAELAPTDAPSAPRDPAPVADGVADRTAVAADLGWHGAPAGSTFRYRVTDAMTFVIHSAEGAAQPAGSMDARCEVTTTVLDRRGDGILVRQELHGLEFLDASGQPIAGDAAAERYLAAAATPVLMHFDSRGIVVGYGFADGLDGEQRNFLRGTLSLFSIEEPRTDVAIWRRTERDNTGEYEAEYTVDAAAAAEAGQAVVQRRRLAYHLVTGQAQAPEHQLRGATRVRFAARIGWVAGVVADEGMTMNLPLADLQVVSSRRAEVVLLESGRTPVDAEVAALWQRAGASVISSEPCGDRAAEQEVEHWRQQLQGVTVEQLLAELQGLLAQQPVDDAAVNAVFLKLQWLAKLDPAAVTAVRDGVLAGTLPAATVGTALSALGAAGTPAAQDALVAVREQRSLAAEVRMAATVAAIQLDAPSADLMQSLWQDVRGGDANGSDEVRDSSLLVLGALSGRSAEPLADGRSPLQAVLAMEQDAVANNDLPTWLLAVGNTGAPEVLAIAGRYVEHVDPAVRGAACVALRRVSGLPAVELLAARALLDREPTVRGEAIRELGRRSEPEARRALERVAAEEPTDELRDKARELLAQAR